MSINKFLRNVLITVATSVTCLKSVCQVSNDNVKYKKVEVTTVKSNIKISWIMNKRDANYFEIQKSLDGQNFKTFMLVLGADPKDTLGCSYECYDKQKAGQKKCFYRLNYVDRLGKQELSEIKMVAFK